MTHANDLHVAMNNGELQWVGNTTLDFGNGVQVVYPFENLPYDKDGLPTKTDEERNAYIENLAQEQITKHQDAINQIQDAVNKGLYGVQTS